MGFNIRGRFKERKYSYQKNRKNKKKKEQIEIEKNKKQEENNKNIFKMIIFSPLILFGFIDKIIEYFTAKSNKESIKLDLNKNNINRININKNKINIDNKNIKKININKISKLQNKVLTIKKKNNNLSGKNEYDLTDDGKEKLENIILLKIKKKINKLNNECDIIESEAYLINKYSNDKELLENAIKIRAEIEKIEEKIQKIDREYNIIKNKIIIDSKELNDEDLINDIIKYKELILKKEIANLPNKIKLLDEYKILAIKIEELEIKTNNLEEKSISREKELSTRDNRYKEAKEKMINLDEINNECNNIIQRNTKYIDELQSKIGTINSKKYTKYKLQGLNNLLSTSLKYIGLLSLTPLRGIIPGIAARTFATRKLVNSMIQNLHYEKQEKIIYSVENYSSEINSKIFNMNTVEENIDLALSDIAKLKHEFKDKFLKYDLKEYEEAYKKIELLEEDIIKNKQKMLLIKDKLIKSQELNKETLVKVRKLNSNK
ncbi:MAG: hypothetical protein ACI310_00230 [Bacilli bacterium]